MFTKANDDQYEGKYDVSMVELLEVLLLRHYHYISEEVKGN